MSFISVFFCLFVFSLRPESRPFMAQNISQISESFLLIYRSIFMAPVRLIIVTLSFTHQLDFLWPESRPNVRAKEMSHLFLAHLLFNFYCSCQADYLHAQYRSSARLFMARISPASRPEFSYGKCSMVESEH